LIDEWTGSIAQVPEVSWLVAVAVMFTSSLLRGAGLPDAFDELNGLQSDSIPSGSVLVGRRGELREACGRMLTPAIGESHGIVADL
jgi:hypothetical protein